MSEQDAMRRFVDGEIGAAVDHPRLTAAEVREQLDKIVSWAISPQKLARSLARYERRMS